MAASLMVAVRVAATPERAFQAFTEEIGRWWKPNGLFQFTVGKDGVLAFEPGPVGRLIETYDDGSVFEVGRVTLWEPPHRLALTWRQASFRGDQLTTVQVSFEPVGDETRVTVEHSGWDTLPQKHVARHGFPLGVFQLRHAEWWQSLLGNYKRRVGQLEGGRN